MKHLITYMLCAFCLPLSAQRITRQYNNVSMADALKELNTLQNKYAVNFIYDDLEDFRVSTTVRGLSVPDAVSRIVGFYPISVTQKGNVILVECTHKTQHHLTGRIIDEQGEAVPFANVLLLSPADSAVIAGGVSNESGIFVVPYETAKVIAKVSYVGYKTVYRLFTTEQAGTIRLQPETQTLQAVTVKGHQRVHQLSSEGLVTNVQGTVLSSAGTANDVIEQLPGVYRENDVWKSFGKGNILIYIDNKRLQEVTELDQLRSTNIASIVVNNNPGAKYGATVKSVMIIKTIRKIGDGLSIATRSVFRQAHYLSLSDGIDFNWRKSGLDIFGTLAYDYSRRYQNQLNRTTVSTSSDMWNLNSRIGIYPRGSFFTVTLGLNYSINEHHSFGMRYNIYPSSNLISTWLTNQNVLQNGNETEHVDYSNHLNSNSKPTQTMNVYYAGKIGKMSVKWDNDLYISESKVVQNIVEKSSISGERTVNSINKANNTMLASKMVVGIPIGNVVMEGGYEYIFTNRKQMYENEQQIVPSTHDQIKEHQAALFASCQMTLGAYKFNAGVRGEHTISDFYEFGNLIDSQSKNYYRLFPDMSLSLPLGKTSCVLSYTAKTHRPTYQQLSSNLQYDDRFTYEQGNPKLQPEIIHDFTLESIYKWLYLSVSYQHIKNPIISLITLQDTSAPLNIFSNVNENHLNKYTATVSLAPHWGIWSPNLVLNLMGQRFSMMHYGQLKDMDNPLLFAQFFNTFSLKRDYRLSLNFLGNTYGDIDVVTLKPSFQTNLGVVKTIKNWTIQLQINDLFKSSRNSMFTYGTHMVLNKWNYSDTQAAILTLRYTFNKVNSKYKGTGAGNEEKKRL